MQRFYQPSTSWFWLALTIVLTTSSNQVVADQSEQDARDESVISFLSQYCLQCHDVGSSEGQREFETFTLPLVSETQLISADEIIDQVTLKSMPPVDSDQPTDQERVDVIEALRESVQDARDLFKSSGSRTVMRRLSTREYENTLAVLMGRRIDTLGLTADFPKENTRDHMDNIGDALVTSGFLLDQYFQAADRLIETRMNKPDTPPRDWHFTNHFVQYEELSGSHKSVFNYEFLCLYEQPNTDTRQGGYGHIEDFLEGVPVSGLYDIEVNAQAMHRDTHYDPKIFRIDFSEPFEIAVVPGDVTKGHIHYPQAIEPILGRCVVPDDAPEWLKFRVWLEAGQTPRFIFPNGPYESRASVLQVNARYKDEFKADISSSGVSRTHLLREGKLPHIKIGEIKIHGPIEEPLGGLEEQSVFGDSGFQAEHAIEQLNDFARRAFRRPLRDADRQRIERVYQKQLSADASPRQAALDTVKMILCSPSFLYLSEITDEDETLLKPHDLAARLSYALWTAPPDDELFAVAASGQLAQPVVLREQAERMLDDARSDEFINGFLDSWLNLRDIGNLPPPRQNAGDYYAEDLPSSMKSEARMFFRNLLKTDGPILDFLDADYTFVDKKLAKLYGLPEQQSLRLADGFQKVSIAGNGRRGGVLGMAGVLTVSANGVDTSPVTRGVWVSENLLGVTPPPPPDDVPPIDANVSGAKTIREKLAMHRQDAACNSCHRKIDPLGFSLEMFDPIGRWRTKYPAPEKNSPKTKIDPSGEFPSGESYKGFDDFKKILIATRSRQFTSSLVEKLLTYSTGRHMERADGYEIDEIVDRVEAEGGGLRTMIVAVLESEIFRSR